MAIEILPGGISIPTVNGVSERRAGRNGLGRAGITLVNPHVAIDDAVSITGQLRDRSRRVGIDDADIVRAVAEHPK